MFRLTWNLSNAARTQIRHLVAMPKQLYVPSASFCAMPPEKGEGFEADLTLGEQKLINKLKIEFPNATHLEVSDVSGGCGAMYQISLETPEFIGKRKIQQHQMVNKVLAQEIKQMHGLQLNTQEPQTTKEK